LEPDPAYELDEHRVLFDRHSGFCVVGCFLGYIGVVFLKNGSGSDDGVIARLPIHNGGPRSGRGALATDCAVGREVIRNLGLRREITRRTITFSCQSYSRIGSIVDHGLIISSRKGGISEDVGGATLGLHSERAAFAGRNVV